MSVGTITDEKGAHSAVTSSARSDIGLRREENQDAHGTIETDYFRIYAVADGMGGVKGGAVASNIAITVLKEELASHRHLDEPELKYVVQKANSKIFEEGVTHPAFAGMGTTLVALIFEGTTLYVVNVGDSRAYRIRQGKITQLTRDHTLVMELVRSGAITPEQAQNHPVSHMLTRSLGPSAEVEVDCTRSSDGPARGDLYVLCSDGLYNLVSDQEILSIVQSHSSDESVEMLIELANERGGTDNITVILARVGDEFPVEPSKFEDAEPEPNGHAVEPPPLSAGVATTPSAQEHGAQTQSDEIRGHLATFTQAVTEALERPRKPLAWLFRTRSLSVSPSLIFILVAGVLIGLFGGPLVYWNRGGAGDSSPSGVRGAEGSSQTSNPSAGSGRPTERVSPGGSTSSPGTGAAPTAGVSSGISEFSGFTTEQRESVTRRQLVLREKLNDLDAKLATFGKPLSNEAAAALMQSALKVERLQAEVDEIRAKIDVATRKLAVWYGRRKKLSEVDPINLGFEVAISSDVVRDRKEKFEKATYQYMREAEVLIYNPGDEAQQQKVSALIKAREETRADYTEEIRRAIEAAVGDADHHITELTIERDQAHVKLEAARRDGEFARVMMGNDARAKDLLKDSLTKERDTVRGELSALEKLLPGM